MSERIYLDILVHPALPLSVPHLLQPVSASLQVSNTKETWHLYLLSVKSFLQMFSWKHLLS